MQLRSYQQSIYDQIISSNTDDLFQLDTGGGKTPIIAKLSIGKPTVIICHRNFLVEQISQTLTKNGESHRIIGNSLITKRCQLFQRKNKVEHGGHVWVATIQSLVSRYKNGKLGIDCAAVEQVIIDEAHHVAEQNMWASVKDIFPNARFIGATATPCRLDGQGQHKDCGGLYDNLVQAEQLKDNATQWLIANGYLSDYEYWCPPTDGIDFTKLRKGKIDFTIDSLGKVIENPELVAGSVIEQYKRLAYGKCNLVYAVSIENARLFAEAFKQAGFSATYIASSLSLTENIRRVDAFMSGDVTVLINVEMVTEGFDLPEIECVQKVRPTSSFALDRQMNGRNLRPKPNGGKAVFIDHVGNVLKHGLPDDNVKWSLYGTPKNKSEPKINCNECGFLHNPYLAKCPNCGLENWLKNPTAENDPRVVSELVDIQLVRKVRKQLEQQEIEAKKQAAIAEHERLLSTQLIMPTWDYGLHAVGQLCNKLVTWFIENLKDHLSIIVLNGFTTGKQPDVKFWTSHFTIHDLKTMNSEKCKKVFKKWQSN
ncbi:MAG: DEAD/DEAH box helicase family protein [Acinetobacter sp.]|nr:DEAD/DEAH box helicase family protein [Acinetobacter sp.]